MGISFLYFNALHAIEVHDWIIETSGGFAGTKDIGRLESVLEHIKNDLYYPCFEDKLTHLVFSINKFHAFNDGNKRSSLVLGAYFLEINGYDFCVQKFALEMENIVVWVAENKVNKELLQKLITSLIMDDEYPEVLKLELLEAIDNDA
ncbi:type II toxin-antitoxin system death-on-curing family toxin [Paraglaciecola aquimarina]|uniref:Type II toxin-antitoxin system death-on-curing family toxin n=1 Tax=Paraglaciecola aquimarina TaxID=1235557 RepID=A0ABU3SUU5_9ALTE|nr:type II toxin-antitoxin system death-on-curing family toxin [Paraglaciecola aquimarina]MDU0353765.1 type II toxin-antitoxin system death-on-curing family toxin [Paraglaciecola aquimarina]